MKFQYLLLILLFAGMATATECGVCVCEESVVEKEIPEEINMSIVAMTIFLVLAFVVLLVVLIFFLNKEKQNLDEEVETSYY